MFLIRVAWLVLCCLLLQASGELTEDGLEIRWASSCSLKEIHCNNSATVRILSKYFGTKYHLCDRVSADCCTFQNDKRIECIRTSEQWELDRQISNCRNRSVCFLGVFAGNRIYCEGRILITTFAAVSYACEGGDPSTTPPTTPPTTPTTTTTTTPTTSATATSPAFKPVKNDDKVDLGLVLGVTIGCVFIIAVVILCVIYVRFYHGKTDFLRANKALPSVTQLGMKTDKSGRVKSAPRFKLATLNSSTKGLPLTGSLWSRSGLAYKDFGFNSEHSMSSLSYAYMSAGNLWKRAHWLTSLNSYSRMPGQKYKKRTDTRSNHSAISTPIEKERDVDSIGGELEAFPDIGLFTVPDTAHSPDSGLDNPGYIVPVIPGNQEFPSSSDQRGIFASGDVVRSPRVDSSDRNTENIGRHGKHLENIFRPLPLMGNDEQQENQLSKIDDNVGTEGPVYKRIITKVHPLPNDSVEGRDSEMQLSHPAVLNENVSDPRVPDTGNSFSNLNTNENSEMLY